MTLSFINIKENTIMIVCGLKIKIIYNQLSKNTNKMWNENNALYSNHKFNSSQNYGSKEQLVLYNYRHLFR